MDEVRGLNQADLDVRELESRIELMMVAANDECWSHNPVLCECNGLCNCYGVYYGGQPVFW